MTAHRGLIGQALNLAVCVSGIILCYSASSYFQEKITQGKYAPGDKFTFTQTLVFVQCFVNTVVAFLGKTLDSKAVDTVPTSMYAFSAGSYLLAMIFSNQALRYVSYPTQVLGKSCKPIPIMIFGVLFAHKSYSFHKYLTVLAIVAGVAVFLYKDEKAVAHGHAFEIGYGELLLIASLAMDGTTGAIQDRIRRHHQTNKWSMMLNMNMFSLLFALFPVSQEYNTFLNFVSRYPNVPLQILILACCACIGQCFIFKTVTDFGPLTCSIITTTRKLITIIASVILFNHPMSQRQVMGTAIVFLALLVDAIEGKKSHSAKVAATATEKEKLITSTGEKEDGGESREEVKSTSPVVARRTRARRAD